MKIYFIFLISFFLIQPCLLAQPPAEERIPEKMSVFIAKRMQLSENEMGQFKSVFSRYHKEWRESMKKYREDRLLMQQQVIELQIKYRKEFAPIVGERRVIKIYDLQQDFIQILRDVQRDRMQGAGHGPMKRMRGEREQGPERRMGPPPPPPGRGQDEEDNY